MNEEEWDGRDGGGMEREEERPTAGAGLGCSGQGNSKSVDTR